MCLTNTYYVGVVASSSAGQQSYTTFHDATLKMKLPIHEIVIERDFVFLFAVCTVLSLKGWNSGFAMHSSLNNDKYAVHSELGGGGGLTALNVV